MLEVHPGFNSLLCIYTVEFPWIFLLYSLNFQLCSKILTSLGIFLDYLKQTKAVTDQSRPWGDTIAQCIMMPGIWSWSRERTLMENQWNPNEIRSLLNNHVPMSNFFALTHNKKCYLWRKVSLIYTTLNLSLFQN